MEYFLCMTTPHQNLKVKRETGNLPGKKYRMKFVQIYLGHNFYGKNVKHKYET